jgi:DNA-directed RNA polymerase subunit RPC12/RpoP
MELNTRRCMQCKGEMTMTVLDPIAGEDQGVAMRIERMPAMHCSDGHKRFIAPEFAVRMMEAFVAGEPLAPLAPAVEKGLLRKRLHCPACGAELAAPAAERIEAKRAVTLKGLEAFDVQVAIPKYRCAACGKESLPPASAVNDRLMKASIQAFRAGQLTPT